MTRRDAKNPGARWRVRSGDDGAFDELAVGGWLHVERIDHRQWFISIGDATATVSVEADGRVRIQRQEGFGFETTEARGPRTEKP